MHYGRLNLNSHKVLSAKKFIDKNNNYSLFLNIIDICKQAHQQIKVSKVDLNGLTEPVLRNKLVKQIEKIQGYYGLAQLVFVAESVENNENDITIGYHDIEIFVPPTSKFSLKPKNRFIIECKKLDGYSTLNDKYITEGMNRFISEKYSSPVNICGMIGFVEQSNKKYCNDKITSIVNDINIKLTKKYKRNSSEYLLPIMADKNVYKSTHYKEKSNTELNMYHLFLDNTKDNKIKISKRASIFK